MSREVMQQALEALKDGLSVCRSVSLARDRLVRAENDVPMYTQTEEWCQWARSEVGPVIANAIAALRAALAEQAQPGHLDPNEDDASVLWAEIWRLRSALQGPDGYATWQDAATAERIRRVAAERKVAEQAQPVAWAAKHISLKQKKSGKLWLTLELAAVEGWPTYWVVRSDARGKCSTPRGCVQHGCHGECLMPAPVVPPGWRMVPVEPTEAMVDATHHGQPVADIYRDTLAAAPQAPTPPAPQPLTEREIELLDGMIEVQLQHAAQCDLMLARAGGNHKMAVRQKGWDMERVELLRKIKRMGAR